MTLGPGAFGLVLVPLLPWWMIAALAAASVLLTALALWRRARGAGLRGLALVAGLAALANPISVDETRDPLDDVAIIVVDESLSQRVGERREATEAARTALASRIERLDGMALRIVTAGAPTAAEDGGEAGDGTLLFAALEDALADIAPERVAGVVMITDGQVHDVPANAARLGLRAPLHVLLSGRRDEQDRRLVVEQAPRYGIVGETLALRLRVEDETMAPGSAATVTLRRDGGPPQRITVTIGQSREIPFELDHGGTTVLEITADAGRAELTLDNNRAVTVINGVRDRLRVLLVSGEPHAGERTWRNLLKADPSVDLVHFTILRPPEKQDGTPIRELALIAFPIRELFEVKLGEFDLIIFDRYNRRGVLPLVYFDNIVRYVREGGAVLVAAGPGFAGPLSLYRSPLSEIFPARPTGKVLNAGFRPQVLDRGRRHPVTADLAGLNDGEPRWGRWFRLIDAEADSGTVVMHGTGGRPVLVLDRIGKGRVAQLLSDHVWLWDRGFEGGGPQAELLRRLAHWLMQEPELEEDALRAVSHGGRLEIERRSLEPDDSPVTVTFPSGATREVALTPTSGGRSTARIAVAEAGLYRLGDGRRSAVAAVGALNPREFADLRTTARRLQPIVEASGGGVHWVADGGGPSVRKVRPGRSLSGPGWIGFKANRRYLVTGMEQTPLLPPFIALVLVLGTLAMAWRAEGR